jgi:hypothetical protein
MFRRIAFVAAALVLGGCASQVVPGGPVHPIGAPQSPPTAQDLAKATSLRQLASFTPPKGARKLSGPPSGAGTLQPGSTTGTPSDTARGTRWFEVPGSPRAVLASVKAPAGSKRSDSSSSSDQWSQAFEWSASDQLYDDMLEVSTMALHGRTVMRVDSLVVWYPERPADTRIPSTATSLTVTYRPASLTGHPKTYGPVTTSDADEIAEVAAAVNDDPMNPLGSALPCPFDGGANVTLTFRDGTRTVATTSITPAGCGFVTVKVTGGGTAMLFQGTKLASQVLALLNLDWPDPAK